MRIAAGLIFAGAVSLCASSAAWSQTPAPAGAAAPQPAPAVRAKAAAAGTQFAASTSDVAEFEVTAAPEWDQDSSEAEFQSGDDDKA